MNAYTSLLPLLFWCWLINAVVFLFIVVDDDDFDLNVVVSDNVGVAAAAVLGLLACVVVCY